MNIRTRGEVNSGEPKRNRRNSDLSAHNDLSELSLSPKRDRAGHDVWARDRISLPDRDLWVGFACARKFPLIWPTRGVPAVEDETDGDDVGLLEFSWTGVQDLDVVNEEGLEDCFDDEGVCSWEFRCVGVWEREFVAGVLATLVRTIGEFFEAGGEMGEELGSRRALPDRTSFFRVSWSRWSAAYFLVRALSCSCRLLHWSSSDEFTALRLFNCARIAACWEANWAIWSFPSIKALFGIYYCLSVGR